MIFIVVYTTIWFILVKYLKNLNVYMETFTTECYVASEKNEAELYL